MHLIDYIILAIYMTGIFFVGIYFYRKNKSGEDYYVGGRNMNPYHVGLSVVATDVGGGFSIGLGGLGFTIGLSGSWLLFTGLVGAWLSAIFLIPILKKLDKKHNMVTYPDFLRHFFGKNVAAFAALISGIGYMGFTGGQVLAGAKLASGTLFADVPLPIEPMTFSILIIAGVILLYTVMGGIKAVIYTDTIQWIILMGGLLFLAIPFTLSDVGGLSGLSEKLQPELMTLTNVNWQQIVNWTSTVLPIWLIGMTLYQRMYAVKGEKEAKKAWFFAGLFEYPLMAFAGTFLGMAARLYFPEAEPEMGLPRLLKEVLPIGLQGLIIAAYFSAIMSTADSCLLASSGNIVNDFIERFYKKIKGHDMSHKQIVRVSQIATFLIGAIAILIATTFTSVLDVILQAYSFMVGALTVPTLVAYFAKKHYANSALYSMIAGGATTVLLIAFDISIFGLSQTIWGIIISAIVYFISSKIE